MKIIQTFALAPGSVESLSYYETKWVISLVIETGINKRAIWKTRTRMLSKEFYKSKLIANKVKSGILDSTSNIQTKLVSFRDSIM